MPGGGGALLLNKTLVFNPCNNAKNIERAYKSFRRLWRSSAIRDDMVVYLAWGEKLLAMYVMGDALANGSFCS